MRTEDEVTGTQCQPVKYEATTLPSHFNLHTPALSPHHSVLIADRWLWAILAVALALRLAVWWLAPDAELLGDEREYYAAAAILADGRGFVFFDEGLWVRPPLYVALLAGLFRLFGPERLPVWLAQTALSTATVALVYLLGRLFYDERGGRAVARLAAGLCALYLPFAVYSRLLLSETLFNFLLLLAFVALTWHARRGGRRALVLAGLALGAAILTRGIALGFLAAIPVWLLAFERGDGYARWRRAARRSALVLGVALLAVAPWTARNALAYGRLIPVETTGGYNFWLGAQGGQGAGQIINTLREVPNHGDRQALALRRGWAVVAADPGAYAAKSLREARDLWAINFSAYERLLAGFGRGRVPIPWLALTLALDDLLYLVALPLAPLGWLLTRRREDRRLLGLWLGYSCLAGALFFAIARFRLPLLPFVLLLAARGAVGLRDVLPPRPPHPGGSDRVPRARTPPRVGGAGGRRWLLPALAAVAAVVFVHVGFFGPPTFALGLYRAGVANALAAGGLDRGYDLLAGGRAEAALAAFERLPADFYARPTALAAAYHALGQDERALATLDDERDPLGAALLRGDIFRARGEEARAFEQFNARDTRIASPTERAWEGLFPPPRARLDVGDGLDLGYVRGVALDERDGGATFRWTGPRAELRLAAPATAGGAAVLRLRLRGYRPGGVPPPVRISVGGRPVGTVTPTGEWRVYELPVALDAAAGGEGARAGTIVVWLETATFVLGYADQRRFGVMLDWAELAPAGAAQCRIGNAACGIEGGREWR